jgi:hypothetical protein
VIGYLICLGLLTSLHITRQSDRFDDADYLFFSVHESWETIPRTPIDFDALTPEFFVIPDFLVSADSSDLGRAHGRGALVAVDAALRFAVLRGGETTRGRVLLPLIEIQH